MRLDKRAVGELSFDLTMCTLYWLSTTYNPKFSFLCLQQFVSIGNIIMYSLIVYKAAQRLSVLNIILHQVFCILL